MCGGIALLLFFLFIKSALTFFFHFFFLNFEVNGNFFWWFSIKQLYEVIVADYLIIRVHVQLSRRQHFVCEFTSSTKWWIAKWKCGKKSAERKFHFHFWRLRSGSAHFYSQETNWINKTGRRACIGIGLILTCPKTVQSISLPNARNIIDRYSIV